MPNKWFVYFRDGKAQAIDGSSVWSVLCLMQGLDPQLADPAQLKGQAAPCPDYASAVDAAKMLNSVQTRKKKGVPVAKGGQPAPGVVIQPASSRLRRVG